MLEAGFRSAATPNCILSATAEAIILAVNDAFVHVTLRTREQLLGLSVFDAFPDDPIDQGDSGEAAFRLSIRQVLDTKKPHTLPVQRYPIEIRQADGTCQFEDRYWNAVSVPLFDDQGALLCISHATVDITEQLVAEKSAQVLEDRMRAFFIATADVVYRMSPTWSHMHSLDGRGILKNTREWTEYRIEDYVPPDDRKMARAAIEHAVRTKTVFALEHRVLRADGTERWTYSRAVPILNESGDIEEWIGAASDITERKLADVELRAVDRRRNEFLAMLAHELRNPLAPISTAAQLLLMADSDQTRLRKSAEITFDRSATWHT